MRIDKKEHQQLLIEIINQARFPGDILEYGAELKAAILSADIGPEPTPEEREE